MDEREIRFHPSRRAGLAGMAPLHAQRLYELLGKEAEQAEVARLLRQYAQGEKPSVTGAAQITCSDEAEQECVDAFQRHFVRYLLPSMKFSTKAAFRSANLGARYEWGAVRIAEAHFAQAQKPDTWKLFLLKINAHVSVEEFPEGPRYGCMGRYGESESTYCGALHAILSGSDAPFAQDLSTSFGLEGADRIQALREGVDPSLWSFHAALLSARLQARRAMMDIQDHGPRAATLYVVVPCVSLNRKGHDTEIVVGIYTADRRTDERHDEYCGLGDRPEAYRIERSSSRLQVTDPSIGEPRQARDHRALVLDAWREQLGPDHQPDARLRQALEHAESEKHAKGAAYAKPVLRTLLAVMLEVSPVPVAMFLFGAGLVDIHHASKAHRLAREAESDEAAREMLTGIREEIEALPPERAEHLVELLLQEYRR